MEIPSAPRLDRALSINTVSAERNFPPARLWHSFWVLWHNLGTSLESLASFECGDHIANTSCSKSVAGTHWLQDLKRHLKAPGLELLKEARTERYAGLGGVDCESQRTVDISYLFSCLANTRPSIAEHRGCYTWVDSTSKRLASGNHDLEALDAWNQEANEYKNHIVFNMLDMSTKRHSRPIRCLTCSIRSVM